MKGYMVIVGISALFHLLIPLGFGLWLAISRGNHSKLEWILARLALITYSIVIFLGGAGWHIYGIYTRWILLCIVIGLCIPGIRTLCEQPVFPKISWSGWPGWLKLSLFSCLVLVFVLQTIQFLSISSPDEQPLRLKTPFKQGTYLVVQGGPTRLNHHASVKAQEHALDIVKLNSIGTRASGFLPVNLSDYEIFGEPLYAPCSGTILDASEDLQDQRPPERNLETVPGNYISLDCGEHIVLIAHLKHDSLKVKPGRNVKVGTHLANVGNTGNTTEPHLHIHAVKGDENERKNLFYEASGVPIQFRGHAYPLVRNIMFRVHQKN